MAIEMQMLVWAIVLGLVTLVIAATLGTAQRALAWAQGSEPADLPRVLPADTAVAAPRDVFLYFISAAKERNPAAAMALIARLRG